MYGYVDQSERQLNERNAQIHDAAREQKPADVPFAYSKGRAAVLLVDPQHYFANTEFRGTQETEQVASRLNQAMWDFRHAGLRIYVVRTARAFNTAASHAHDFYGFRPEPQDIIIDKTEDSAFPGYNRHPKNNLADILRRDGIGQLLIAGFNLNGCVKANALNCGYSGFKAVVMKSLCANDKTNLSEAFMCAGSDSRSEHTIRVLNAHGIPVKDFGEVYSHVNPPTNMY